MSNLLPNTSSRSGRNGNSHDAPVNTARTHGLLSHDMFARTVYLEHKRSERSGRGFVVMTLESAKLFNASHGGQALAHIVSALSGCTRDTDVKGWYRERFAIGVLFTEVGLHADTRPVIDALLAKVTGALSDALTGDEMNQIRISFRAFPEEWDQDGPPPNAPKYDDLLYPAAPKLLARLLKRLMDVIGSLVLLLVLLPVFAAIAIAVKLTSRGPMLFRQARLGQYGKRFSFLKFRSMYVNNDPGIHREFVQKFIAGGNGCHPAPETPAPYKLAADPRITPLGRVLRTTSMDELPQLLNVLKGEMSLVGPRPPLPYEAECYQRWHRARLLAAKPGITGLWQVAGRSRVKFDEMVRMDLRYAKSWSLWLDIKILLQTPRAVLSGNGAQ